MPSKELFPFIKHYLFLESSGIDIKKLRLFSDGNTGIVFSPENDLALGQKDNTPLERLPHSFLYGQITAFKDIFLLNETRLIIVVFQPDGINKLLGLPANELQDLFIRTEDVFGKDGSQLAMRLFEKNTTQEKVRILNTFFIDLAVKQTLKTEALISPVLTFIFRNKGMMTMSQLVKFTGYTERHLERKFLTSIGITPKKFINIVKLHNFLKKLNEKPSESLTQSAYEAGYADQSHLIKEFKKHTGITPGLYSDKSEKMAVNLVVCAPASPMSDLYNFPEMP
ncbi:AraC family transcriptional regulator [Chitinophaga vietnamensis]|uniref:AraC family transcriptional regulator n=1 Tax=Chitinophaga vietnamensis TaxID=2593957 RepID=UPI00191BF906|nr:helix-turn-helix domain-containing protein [Chitinophaga vietnamensis]